MHTHIEERMETDVVTGRVAPCVAVEVVKEIRVCDGRCLFRARNRSKVA